MMMMSGPENDTKPTKVGFPVIDIATGMLGALSITSAIYRLARMV
jgi:crotonobetainyl-CoA:carnitine CoA-transferase CaiB-like acyl-CoA transferase